MKDKRLPDGKCDGRDLPDRGVKSGVTDTYGASHENLANGHTGKSSIKKHTGSDK